MTSTGVNTSTMLPVRELGHWVSYAETWPCLQRIQGCCILNFDPPKIKVWAPILDPHHQTEIDRKEKVQRTAARCRRLRNQSYVEEMLEELQWPELQERRQQASLTFFYKLHNNLVTTDKNKYLRLEVTGVPDPTPFSITD